MSSSLLLSAPLRVAALLATGLLLAGCAEVLREAERGALPPETAGPVELQPLPAITGGRLTAAVGPGGLPLPAAGGGQLRLLRPVALAARDTELAVADAALDRLFRIDAVSGLVSVLPVAVTPDMQLAFAPDRRLLVIDGVARRVAQLSVDGVAQPALGAGPLELGKPVDVATDARRGIVYIADGLYRQVLAFHPAGGAYSVILPRDAQGNGPRELTAVAAGPRGLYLLDGSCRCVLLVDGDGRILGRFGGTELVAPVRIAADGVGRVFVADDGARELRVYADGKLLQSFAYRSFGLTRITALKLGGATLYLAGADDGRIEARRIAPGRGAAR